MIVVDLFGIYYLLVAVFLVAVIVLRDANKF